MIDQVVAKHQHYLLSSRAIKFDIHFQKNIINLTLSEVRPLTNLLIFASTSSFSQPVRGQTPDQLYRKL
jgi:hypothetical protein